MPFGLKKGTMLDEITTQSILSFACDVKQLPNESAKTHRFAGLIENLFPRSKAITKFAAGIEKFIRIDTADEQKTGRIDAYYGNAIIEFENSLKATERTALSQLKDYTAGVWQRERGNPRPILCIATDGITWKTYKPRHTKPGTRPIIPQDIELTLLQEITLSENTLKDFWMWLTGLLFRPAAAYPTADRFRLDFGTCSPAYADAITSLSEAWNVVGNDPHVQTAYSTWKKYLTITYGALTSDLKSLFLKHTYLASLAKFMAWASISRGKTTSSYAKTAEDVLSGQFFKMKRIDNLVDQDFFQWVRNQKADQIISKVWERIISELLSYDLSRIGQDVFKGVYQELVDPSDRHDLGEYYTPDWLCEKIIKEIIPSDKIVSILDPTCGSGSFLYAAISHLIKSNRNKDDGAAVLSSIVENVVGIDIHPLAVTIARVTYLLAIQKYVSYAKNPIQIPVYLADSLFLPREVKQLTLGDSQNKCEINFSVKKKVEVPERIVQAPELFDPAIAASSLIAEEHAKTGRESKTTLKAYLQRTAPKLLSGTDAQEVLNSFWELTKELADLIVKGQNSIWAYVISNAYRPAMLKNRFDYIVGNPPWLSYRYINDPDYQEQVKRRATQEYKIAPKQQKLFTQMELATVFLIHSVATFGKDNSKIAFVVPRSILTADQHHNLRVRAYSGPMTVESYWDLFGVSPLFNVPSCVLIASRKYTTPGNYTLPAVELTGRLPERDLSLKEAKKYLTEEQKTATVIRLGKRTAFSTQGGRTNTANSSAYAKGFYQGATLVPRNFYFIKIETKNKPIEDDKTYWAETDKEVALSAKKPWDDVKMEGNIEGKFIFSTALSRHLLPFVMLEPITIVLPIIEDRGRLSIVSSDRLMSEGYRNFAKWMKQVETIWESRQGRKNKKINAYQWLDYRMKLTNQHLKRHRYLVLYNAAGTNICATMIDRISVAPPFIVEHKTYWCSCETEDEAYYLTAILNANIVNDEIKPFQSVGLQGERDIEKKVLDLPIPYFHEDDKSHRNISKLGKQCTQNAAAYIKEKGLPRSLSQRRSVIRKHLEGLIEKIDVEVSEILQLCH